MLEFAYQTRRGAVAPDLPSSRFSDALDGLIAPDARKTDLKWRGAASRPAAPRPLSALSSPFHPRRGSGVEPLCGRASRRCTDRSVRCLRGPNHALPARRAGRYGFEHATLTVTLSDGRILRATWDGPRGLRGHRSPPLRISTVTDRPEILTVGGPMRRRAPASRSGPSPGTTSSPARRHAMDRAALSLACAAWGRRSGWRRPHGRSPMWTVPILRKSSGSGASPSRRPITATLTADRDRAGASRTTACAIPKSPAASAHCAERAR